MHPDSAERFKFFVLIAVVAIAVSTGAFAFSTDFWLRLCAVTVSIAALYLGFKLASERTVTDNHVRLKILSLASAVLLPYLKFRSELLNQLEHTGLPISSTPLWGRSEEHTSELQSRF